MVRPLRPSSWVVAGGRHDDPGAPLNVPLVPASNFLLGTEAAYSRDDGTPTWDAFERVVGGLEDATAVAFSSGMAAIAAVFDLLVPGAHVVWPEDCYQGVAGLVREGERAGRWTSTRLPTTATDAWCAAAADADLVWVESPSNPLLEVADLHRIAAVARRPGALLAVDNTLAGPLLQRPLDLGADLAVQSATKHLGGHSDLLCGVTATRDPALVARLRHTRTLRGATPGALETFLAVRGIRTLAVRTEVSQRNAGALAGRLADHPAVEVVRYPGLTSHATHDVARAQLGGFGSVITFDVVGGGPAADAVCAAVRLVRHATSFGAVESTIERRSVIPGQEHLPAGLLRLSVGIEDVEDLWTDLDAALRSCG